MNTSDAEAAKLYLEYVKAGEQQAALKLKLKGTPFAKVLGGGKAKGSAGGKAKAKVKSGGVKKAKAKTTEKKKNKTAKK
jgi:hypothetical protein